MRADQPFAAALIDRAVPFVVQTGTGLPPELAAAYPDVPQVRKPLAPDKVVARLLQAMGGSNAAAMMIQ